MPYFKKTATKQEILSLLSEQTCMGSTEALNTLWDIFFAGESIADTGSQLQANPLIVIRFVDRYYHTPLKVKLARLLNQISEKLVK